jgi:g-D-glutamyl-meso-diaminopimelate peptidase
MPSVALSYHSSGREIFWKGINKRDQLKKHRTLAKKVSALTKYPLSTPEPQAIGGGFTDWFISTYHNPAMTVEISYLVEETNPPLSVFPEEWNRNKYVGIMLATEIAREIQLDKDK